MVIPINIQPVFCACISCMMIHCNFPYCCTDPSKNTCFGGGFGQFLTQHFLGYDMMVISSFRGLLPSNRGKLSLRVCLLSTSFTE